MVEARLSRPPAVLPNRQGTVVGGRYFLGELLGVGGMATVHCARDQVEARDVAVKILKPEVKNRSVFEARFEREVVMTGLVRHPAIVPILAYGVTEEGLPYQVMELVKAQSLAEVLAKEGPLEPQRALHIQRQILSALAACHRVNVIHRDVKPENILLYDKDGLCDLVKLIDFGVAKPVGECAVGKPALTNVGLIVGTPTYIAPDWITREEPDFRADLYSATVVLFEMLTGVPPLHADDRRAQMKLHLTEPPPSLVTKCEDLVRYPQLEELEALVRTGLAKEPEHRFADASTFLAEVARLMTPSLDARRSIVGGTAFVVTAVLLWALGGLGL